MTRLGRALIFSVLLGVATPASILAQEAEPAPATDPSEDRAASFRTVDGAVSEDVPGGALLVGAYGAVLVLLLGYVLWLGSLQSGANREISRLAAALEKNRKKSGDAGGKAGKAEPEKSAAAEQAAGAASD